MRVKLDEENQKIITCPEGITKTKTVVQSELQEDGTFKDVEIPTSYDVTGYQNSQESLDEGYVDIDDSLITLFNQNKAIIQNNSIVDIQETEDYGKIDFTYFPFLPNIAVEKGGDYLRNKIDWYIIQIKNGKIIV